MQTRGSAAAMDGKPSSLKPKKLEMLAAGGFRIAACPSSPGAMVDSFGRRGTGEEGQGGGAWGR